MNFEQYLADPATDAPEPEDAESRVVRAARPAGEPVTFAGERDLVAAAIAMAAHCGVTIDPRRVDLRPHACHLCAHAHQLDPRYVVQECERIVWSGRVYRAWACKFHVDIDWSKRFQARLAKASPGPERERLQAEETKR